MGTEKIFYVVNHIIGGSRRVLPIFRQWPAVVFQRAMILIFHVIVNEIVLIAKYDPRGRPGSVMHQSYKTV